MNYFRFLLFIAFSSCLTSFSQNKDSLVNHGHFLGGGYGNVFIEASFKDQLLNGPFIIKNSKRQVLLKGNFSNNQKSGEWQKYYVKDTTYYLKKKIEYLANKPAAILLETDSTSRKITIKNKVLDFMPDTMWKFDSLVEYIAIEKQIVPSRNGSAFNYSEYGNLISRLFRGISKNNFTLYSDAALKNKLIKPVFSETNKAISLRTCDHFIFLKEYGLFQKVISVGLELKDGTIYWISLKEIESKGLNVVIDYSMYNAIKQNLLPSRLLFENNPNKTKIAKNETWENRSKQLLMELYCRELFQ